MKKIYVGMLLNVLFGTINAQSFSWAKKGGLWAYDYGYGIANDNSGNVYLAGKYEMNANFSGVTLPCQGNHDIYVAQYSPSGNLNWIRTGGGSAGDYAHALACDGNFVYIAGEIEGTGTIIFPGSSITLHGSGNNDIFVAKYTLSGTLLWAKRAGGGSDDKALGVTYDNAGNIYICGYYNNYASFGSANVSGHGNNDIFIAKYDANGNFQWVRTAGSGSRDEAKSIKCDAAGNVYITGLYKNGCVFGSQTLGSANGYFDMFLAKYSSSGNLLWVKHGGGNYDDVGWGVTIDTNDKIYVAGEFNASAAFGSVTVNTSGSSDVLVACYDASGNVMWVRKAGGGGEDRARGIGCSGTMIYVTGQFASHAMFGSFSKTAADNADIFVACLDNAGNFKWVMAPGGQPDASETLGYESGDAVCAQSNNVFATGAMLNGATFGSTTLSAYSRTDVFITKITAPPLQGTDSTLVQNDTAARKEADSMLVERTGLANEPGLQPGSMNVYPNPGDGNFMLDLNVQDKQTVEMVVINSLGEVVGRRTLAGVSKTLIDLADYEKGIYIIEVSGGEAILKKKVIIQ